VSAIYGLKEMDCLGIKKLNMFFIFGYYKFIF